MPSAQLLDDFEHCRIPAGSFRHREHLEVAWLYRSRHELLVALNTFVEGIKRLANFYGATGKYHETITWAYLFVVHERMQRAGVEQTWRDFEANNPDLFAWPSPVLARYYRDETLQSDIARSIFLLPDRLQ